MPVSPRSSPDDMITASHILCDHEDRLRAIEEKLKIKLPAFWDRRQSSAVKYGESKSHVDFCKRMAALKKYRDFCKRTGATK